MTKIILLDGPLYQWDTGRKVQVVPDAGATIHEVHVAHSGEDGAFVLQPDENGCAVVPSKSLQSPGMVVVYAVTVTADGRQTETSRSFFIAARSKPDDYIYTEEELQTYQALEQRIETLEKGGASDEVIAEAVDKYLAENPVTGGATPEQAEQIEANAQAIKELQEGGVQGPQGETGPAGPAGPAGERGPAGPAGEDGEDGFSPTVDLARTTTGVKITVTNKDGTQTATVYDGKDGTGGSGTGGADGKDGVTFTPSVSAAGVISWTNDGELTNPTPVSIKGPKGDTGETGPEGPQGPAGSDGKDGQDGQNGEDGADGFSPTVAVSTITGGHRVTVTDSKGSKTFDVMNGAKGDKGDTGDTGPAGPAGSDGKDGGVGPEGPQGPAGDDGADGFSPTVKVTTITGGHKVTITDASGSKSFNVMDGEKGEQGEQGEQGPAGSSASSTPTTYTVSTTAFVNAGAITAHGINGILKVGGYFEAKTSTNTDGATPTVICYINGVYVMGNTYAVAIDHAQKPPKAYNLLLLTEGSGSNRKTRVQFDPSTTAFPAHSWMNFSLFSIIEG